MARNVRKSDSKNLYLQIETLEDRIFLDASLAFPLDIANVDYAAIDCEASLIEPDVCFPADEISDPVIIEEELLGTQNVETQVDDQGRVIFQLTQFDDNADGVIDWSFSYQYSYNAQGQVTSEIYQEDYNGDGNADYRSTNTNVYDDNGNLISNVWSSDYDGDGNADYSSTSTNVYDENGNLISSTWSSDDDGDGIADYSSTSTNVYDDNGNLISSTWSSDDDGDGNADYVSTTTNAYDDNGNLISSVWTSDNNGDGIFDSVGQMTTDADGVVTYEEDYDEDFDGDIDFRLLSSYDAEGNELLYQTWTDSDGDGIFTETTTQNEVNLTDPPSDVVIYDFMKSTDAPTEVPFETALNASSDGAPEIVSEAVQTVDSSFAGFYFSPVETNSLGTPTGLSIIAFTGLPSAFGSALVFASDSRAAQSSAEPLLTIDNSDESVELVVDSTTLTSDSNALNSNRLGSQVETEIAENLGQGPRNVAS